MEKHPSEKDQAEKNVENVEAAMLAAGGMGANAALGGTFPGGMSASGMTNAGALGALAMTGGLEGVPPPEEENSDVLPEEEV